MFGKNIKFFQKAVLFHPLHNRFLALKRAAHDASRPNEWDLPGGSVSFGENHLEAIHREIREETGLSAQKLHVLEVVTLFDPQSQIYRIFIGHQGRASSEQVSLSHEHSDYKWVTKEEFLALDTATLLKKMMGQLTVDA